MTPRLIVHGGAWDWADALDQVKATSLKKSLSIGWDILQSGGSALDAIEKAVNWLEDDPLFDAGHGSHLNADGVVEMDAILIDAKTYNFGAVAGVTRVQYPISLARRILEDTEQNLFVGAGADALAARLGMPTVSNVSLMSADELQNFRNGVLEGTVDTVGAIAIDAEGNIAVATSTGGTPLKPAGRVGDSPVFGAGGYALHNVGGAGATGQGEHCMRVLLSKYVVDKIAEGCDAQTAAHQAIDYVDNLFERSMVGTIVLDANGNLGAAHSTPKLACGWIDENGTPQATMSNGINGNRL